jgi:hypothetical protein
VSTTSELKTTLRSFGYSSLAADDLQSNGVTPKKLQLLAKSAVGRRTLEVEHGLRRTNPKMTALGYGFYKISDADAEALVKRGGDPLPKNGESWILVLPDQTMAHLQRTPHKGRLVWALVFRE